MVAHANSMILHANFGYQKLGQKRPKKKNREGSPYAKPFFAKDKHRSVSKLSAGFGRLGEDIGRLGDALGGFGEALENRIIEKREKTETVLPLKQH